MNKKRIENTYERIDDSVVALTVTSRTHGPLRVLLSPESEARAREHHWSFWSRKGDLVYFAASAGGPPHVLLHRHVVSCPPGLIADHISGDTLDCRLSNLRVTTQAENCRNKTRPAHGTTSGILGVCWSKFHDRWVARYGGRYLGLHKTVEAAATRVQAARAEHLASIRGEP